MSVDQNPLANTTPATQPKPSMNETMCFILGISRIA